MFAGWDSGPTGSGRRPNLLGSVADDGRAVLISLPPIPLPASSCSAVARPSVFRSGFVRCGSGLRKLGEESETEKKPGQVRSMRQTGRRGMRPSLLGGRTTGGLRGSASHLFLCCSGRVRVAVCTETMKEFHRVPEDQDRRAYLADWVASATAGVDLPRVGDAAPKSVRGRSPVSVAGWARFLFNPNFSGLTKAFCAEIPGKTPNFVSIGFPFVARTVLLLRKPS